MEIWKEISWFEGIYKISNLGRVKSLDRIIIYKNWIERRQTWIVRRISYDKKWYKNVILCKNNEQFTYTIHRLIAKTFILNPNNKPAVNHINWIKDDNSIVNLEWVTSKENSKHAISIWLYNPLDNIGIKKIVSQYTLEWLFVRKFDSLTKASYELWISIWNISSACWWRYKTAWWFIWKYA